MQPFCGGKEIIFTYFEGVFLALVIQQAMRICHIVSAVFTTLKYFPKYLTKGTIYETQLIKICVLIVCTYLIWYIYHSKKTLPRYYNKCTMFPCTLPVILVRLLWILNFLETLLRNFVVFNFIKLHPVGSYFLHVERRTEGEADKRTDRYDEGNCHFLQFWESS